MCRQAAFPPNFPRKEAISILKNFAKGNTDGVGYVYNDKDKFMVYKNPLSFRRALKNDPEGFLKHMPYNGWTLVHLRAASYGVKSRVNTHPFVVGDWAVVHNGTWHEHSLIKMAWPNTKFEGQTDSEVATHLISMVGPKKFAAEIEGAGVFLALNRDGSLQVMRTSGDLCYTKHEGRTLLASELNLARYDYKRSSLGWFHYDKEGHLLHKKTKKMPVWMQQYEIDVDNIPNEPLSRADLERGLVTPASIIAENEEQLSKEENKALRDYILEEELANQHRRLFNSRFGGETPFCHGFD